VDVFDISFQPVTVDFRPPHISESKESIYYQLDDKSSVKAEKVYSMPKAGACHRNFRTNNTKDDDSYSKTEEVFRTIRENHTTRAFKTCTENTVFENVHHQISQELPIDYDDSSGFESAGIDYIEKNYYKFPPYMLQGGSDKHQLEQSSNILDDASEFESPPKENKVSNGSSNSVISLEAYEDANYDLNSVGNLSLTEEERQNDFIQHYPCNNDLDSQYVFTLENAT